MSVLQFYTLRVKEVFQETSDCISVVFHVPNELEELYRFIPGQYLTIKKKIEGQEIRRSYSICSGKNSGELRVAIKRVENGKFSNFAHDVLKVGDMLEVMPPNGNFISKLSGSDNKTYLAIAAGSGITPIMSILKSVLEAEVNSKFILLYGNRERNSIIFREELEGLKNRYMDRFRLYHVLSRETMDFSLFNGRITAEKCKSIFEVLIDPHAIDETFICGPEEMLFSVRDQLIELGMVPNKVHIELFTSPEQQTEVHSKWLETHKAEVSNVSKVSITLDGTTFDFDLPYNGDSILDAALKKGADLPFACKGGVCSTCRAKLMEGKVEMEVNYSLEPDEIKKGFVLTCQSHPRTERVVIDFDQR